MVDEKKAIKETEKPSKDDVVCMDKVNLTMSSISLQININQIPLQLSPEVSDRIAEQLCTCCGISIKVTLFLYNLT